MSDMSQLCIDNTTYDIKDAVARARNIPAGGSSGQVLAKSSSTDYDVGWVNQSSGGGSIPSTTAMLKGDGSGNAAAATAGTDYVEPSALSGYGTDIDVTAQTQVPYLTTISLKNGNTTLDSANIPLASSTGQGMMSAAMFTKLNGIVTDPSSLFVVASHRIFTSQSVAAKNYREDNTTVTKAGYYPLCISSCNSNTRYAVFYSSYLSNQAVGSVDIHTGLYNADPSSSHSFTLAVHVLWMKVS